MTYPKDPTRWLDPTSDAPRGVRELLVADDADPSEDRVSRLSTRLAGVLGPAALSSAVLSGSVLAPHAGVPHLAPTSVPPSAPPPPMAPPPGLIEGATLGKVATAGGSTVGKWAVGNWLVVGAVAGASIAGTAGIVRYTSRPPDPAPQAVVAPPRAEPPRAPASELAPPVAVTESPEPEAAPPTLPEKAARPRGDRDVKASQPPPKNRQETELLALAQKALAEGRAAQALELTRQHRAIPGALLVQERERLAIEALVRLGRTAQARDRAARFRAAYPKSGYLPRIESLFPGSEQ